MKRILITMTTVLLALLGAAAPAAAHQRGIPDTLMLQPEDLNGAVPGPVEEGLTWPLLPRPCADARIPRPVASRTLAADHSTRYRAYENVARFRGNGAQRYLDSLKAQLAACGVGGGGNGFDPVAEDHLGPGTVLFMGNYEEGDRWVAYVAAAVGRHVVVIMVADSYLGAADPTLANDLALKAIRRVTG